MLSLCPIRKPITFISKTTLQESNIHIHSSVICVNIWTVINKSSGWNIVSHLESVCSLNNSVYNSWSFPSTPPSQFTTRDPLAHGHSTCSVTCPEGGCCTNPSLQWSFKHHRAFYSSQNLPLGKNPDLQGSLEESPNQKTVHLNNQY